MRYVRADFNKETLSAILTRLDDLEEKSVLIGFSTGGLIAYCLSMKKFFSNVIVCSPSPFLKKNLSHLPSAVKRGLGKKLIQDLEHYTYRKSKAKKLMLICGEKEEKLLVQNVKDLGKLNKITPTLIKDAGHAMTQGYVDEVIKKLHN